MIFDAMRTGDDAQLPIKKTHFLKAGLCKYVNAVNFFGIFFIIN